MDENVTLGQNKFGYYNLDKTDGSFVLVIGYRFENAYPFNSNTGLARVVSGGKYGYIDVGGMMKIKPVYDEAEDFDEFSHARVCINGKYGVIDKTAPSPCLLSTTPCRPCLTAGMR